MGERSGIQINRRRPVDGIQVLSGGLKDGGMLSVARKSGDARGLTRGLDRAAAVCSSQNNQRQNANGRTERKFTNGFLHFEKDFTRGVG